MLKTIPLEVSHLCKTFDSAHLLSDISFCIHAGEFINIVGKNNSFKTTLVKILSGRISADSGDILVDGKHVASLTPFESNRLGIVALGETTELCEHLTIAENIYLGSLAIRNRESEPLRLIHRKKVVEYAEMFLKEHSFAQLNPCEIVETLSLAEKQIVALLCSLSRKPKILIIDESFSALNESETAQIFRILSTIKKHGVAILFLSSTYLQLEKIADSFIFIQDGMIKFQASYHELSHIDLSQLDDPFFSIKAYPKLPIKTGDEIFRCENICYGKVLSDVSLKLCEGEIIGIAGKAGVGKTTLARLLAGNLKKDGGKIFLDKKEVNLSSLYVASKLGIRLILDDRGFSIIPHFSLAENLIFPYYNPCNRFFIPVSHRKYARKSYALANKLNIDYCSMHQSPSILSAGNQQKLIISRGIAAHANVFILDEPTRGIDNISKIHIYNAFNNLLREGKSIVILTSDLNEAKGMCDKIYELRDGRLHAQ